MVVKWQAVCLFCGRGGPIRSVSDEKRHPAGTPPSIGGKCPSSPTGKHAPQWQKL